MEIKQVEINDFGPYRGENEIDLSTTDDEPVVLFGGTNGAGKTTLFQAIQICLHGRSALGRRVSEREYKDLIRHKLHDYPDGQAEECSIRLRFDYASMGEVQHYTVERSWRDRGKSIVENLDVRRNGKPPSELDEDQWEDFLMELVPPGVSQLFFFDGEKIQELASAIDDDDDFEESLFSLLGLELVDRLDADLSIYISRKLDQSSAEDITEEIESLRSELEENEAREEELAQKLASKEDRLEEVEKEIEDIEAQIAAEGGAYAEKRDELKDRRAELDGKIEATKDEIREIATGGYPFTLAPDLCEDVVERLRSEMRDKRRAEAYDDVSEEIDEIIASAAAATDEPLLDFKSDVLAEEVEEELENRSEETAEQKLAHHFSQQQRDHMYRVVDQALNQVPEDLAEKTSRLEELTREWQEVETDLSRAPEEDVLSPLVDQLNELADERGALEAEIEDIEEELSKLDTKTTRLQQQIDNRLEEKAELEDVSERAELASNVRDVLEDYRSELAKEKLRQLESKISDRYLSLSNKSDFYQAVEIDEENLSVAVRTAHDNLKPQSELSAGERQIFATALLWALADLADRPLPFMIDTPLGRLDQEHRDNLVQTFLPSAAHQVIVFSTDTEIDAEQYVALADDVATAYHMEYDDHEGYTTVTEGYFWESEEDAEQATLKDVSTGEVFQ